MKPDFSDLLMTLGLGLLGYGLWLITPPLGPIVDGAILMGLSFYRARKGSQL